MKNKLLLAIVFVITAFILFLVRVFFGLPVLLIVILLLVTVLGIIYRRHPAMFERFFSRKEDKEEVPQPVPAIEPIHHGQENKVYLVLTSVHASSRKSITVDKPCFTIGRSRDCNYAIDNKEVSKRHLQIDYRETEKLCYVKDLNSTNGTLLNNMRIESNMPCLLRQGDILQIANEVYQVEYAHF